MCVCRADCDERTANSVWQIWRIGVVQSIAYSYSYCLLCAIVIVLKHGAVFKRGVCIIAVAVVCCILHLYRQPCARG